VVQSVGPEFQPQQHTHTHTKLKYLINQKTLSSGVVLYTWNLSSRKGEAEGSEFKASLGYIMVPCLNNNNKKATTNKQTKIAGHW
jgi:hypothetical protein